ncbi:MAG: pyridoxamine 5'-phosphate oxidase [Deltaproteobacteria bacterium]|nr:MAG: pyridoxamine 5'-phosphate oxidase [Deltaproteobacteria bacterium]
MTKIDPSLRREYHQPPFTEADAAADPLEQFRRWFDEAVAAEIPLANAMTLATASAEGTPSARVVLLKSYDEEGFVFFTNYESRKGRELAENPKGTLLFWWQPLERQIRIEGSVTQVSAAESDEYFATRPRGAQLGGVVSPQSQPITREALIAQLDQVARSFEGKPIPRPHHWGGYRLHPILFEFWQGRPDRLHDRIAYHKRPNGTWVRMRLAP